MNLRRIPTGDTSLFVFLGLHRASPQNSFRTLCRSICSLVRSLPCFCLLGSIALLAETIVIDDFCCSGERFVVTEPIIVVESRSSALLRNAAERDYLSSVPPLDPVDNAGLARCQWTKEGYHERFKIGPVLRLPVFSCVSQLQGIALVPPIFVALFGVCPWNQ